MVLRKINFVASYNPYDELEYIDLEINGNAFRMDKVMCGVFLYRSVCL